MSRSGYHDDLPEWDLIRYRGQVASAIRGRRGQKFLTELLIALAAMPVKRLVASQFETPDGEVCAFGALAKARGLDPQTLDPDDPEGTAARFDVAPQLAREVFEENDRPTWGLTLQPEQRWERMVRWVTGHIRHEA